MHVSVNAFPPPLHHYDCSSSPWALVRGADGLEAQLHGLLVELLLDGVVPRGHVDVDPALGRLQRHHPVNGDTSPRGVIPQRPPGPSPLLGEGGPGPLGLFVESCVARDGVLEEGRLALPLAWLVGVLGGGGRGLRVHGAW